MGLWGTTVAEEVVIARCRTERRALVGGHLPPLCEGIAVFIKCENWLSAYLWLRAVLRGVEGGIHGRGVK